MIYDIIDDSDNADRADADNDNYNIYYGDVVVGDDVDDGYDYDGDDDNDNDDIYNL